MQQQLNPQVLSVALLLMVAGAEIEVPAWVCRFSLYLHEFSPHPTLKDALAPDAVDYSTVRI